MEARELECKENDLTLFLLLFFLLEPATKSNHTTVGQSLTRRVLLSPVRSARSHVSGEVEEGECGRFAGLRLRYAQAER